MIEYPTYNMIHLGQFADIDPDERSFASEKATRIFAGKSFGSAEDPLYGKLTAVTMQDDNGDGQLLTNNWRGEQEKISYSLNGTQTASHEIDGAFTATEVAITRLLPDGRSDTVKSMVRIFQDTSGNVFMIPPPVQDSTQAEVAAVTTYPIVSIALPRAQDFNVNYNAAYAGRHDMASFATVTPPCFTLGTMILTDRGERAVEDLVPGDLVWTRDHGLQPIRWVGRRRLDPPALVAMPRMRPIRIRVGALGDGLPRHDLVVSPQHRVLVRSPIAQRMFGASELLVAAKQMTEMPGIEPAADLDEVTYLHLMFDQHEIVLSNGAETESLYPGPQALLSLGPVAEEIFTLFPDLRDRSDAFPAARPFATGKRARHLVDRHNANARPLVV